MLKNIVKDRLILSPINDAWTPEPLEGGSLYNDLCNKVRRNIENGNDWLWLHNRINGDKMMASEFESLSKKFAVFYSNLGLVAGDTVHLIVGNHNHSYVALGGIWILGGIGSLGDIALDPRAIAGQLKDTNAKLVICTEETAKNAKEAITNYEVDFKKKVLLYSFGEVEGIENILTILEVCSERMAPDPVEIQNPKKMRPVSFFGHQAQLDYPKEFVIVILVPYISWDMLKRLTLLTHLQLQQLAFFMLVGF